MEDPTLQELAWDDLSRQKRKSKKSLLELALKVESLRDIPSDDLDWAMPISEFCKKQLVREPWLLEGFLKRGRVALFAAESKCGKSLVMYDICHGVASGEGWGGFPIYMPGNTLILQTDEPDADCQDRLKFRGLNLLDNSHVITQFNPVCQLPRLERIIKERKIDFIAIDSLTSCGRFSGHSVNDPEAAYFVYQLRDLASKHGVTIFLVHHLNKAPTKGLDKVAGTYGIPAACSDIFLLTKSDDGSTRRKFQRLGGRNGEPKTWEIELNPEDNSWTLLGREEQEKDELGSKIIDHLTKFAPTPFSRKDVALAVNENPNTVGVRLRDMYGDGLVARCKQGRAYGYFLARSDQLISSDLEPDHFANPATVSVSTPTDQLISKIDVFLQTDFENSDRKSSEIPDQLITSHSNPDTVSVRPTDLTPDHFRSVDHFEPIAEVPTYICGTIAQVGDRVIRHGQKGTILALDRQMRGSPKEPFSIWWASVELMSGEVVGCNLQSLDPDTDDNPPDNGGSSPEPDDNGGEECDRETTIEEIDPETNSDVQFAVGDRVTWTKDGKVKTGEIGNRQTADGYSQLTVKHDGSCSDLNNYFLKNPTFQKAKSSVPSAEDWEIQGFRKGDRVRLRSHSFFKGEWHQWPNGELVERHSMPGDYILFDIKLPSGEIIRESQIELDLPLDSQQNLRFGSRIFIKDSPQKQGTLLQKARSASVLFDGDDRPVSIAFSKISLLNPENDKNPFFRAWAIFQKIGKGSQLRAGKHPDHLEEKCTNKIGIVMSKIYKDGKFEAHTEDFKIFNLEAVKIV